MSVKIKIAPHFTELYGVAAEDVPAPTAGESVRAYVLRVALGKEEDILPVVGGRAVPFDYILKEGNELVIYPMAASG